jgi:hypothetical protein
MYKCQATKEKLKVVQQPKVKILKLEKPAKTTIVNGGSA